MQVEDSTLRDFGIFIHLINNQNITTVLLNINKGKIDNMNITAFKSLKQEFMYLIIGHMNI